MKIDKTTLDQLPDYLRNRWAVLGFIIFSLCVFILVGIGSQSGRQASVPNSLWPNDSGLIKQSFASVNELENYLDSSGIEWMPPSGAVIPPLTIDAFPEDIVTVSDVRRKKSLFFRSLLPIVLVENHNISLQRDHVLELKRIGHQNLTLEEYTWLQSIAQWYRVEWDVASEDFWLNLFQRIDRIPVPLVLAQAANESAWGTSRFALQGNNLFGQWTFDESKGLIPKGRKEGERHAVQIFSSLQDSVREYMRNLNTHRAYKSFREARAGYRRLGEPLQADRLAQGLLPYSQRGEAYVEEIRSMIKGNRLTMLKDVELEASPQ